MRAWLAALMLLVGSAIVTSYVVGALQARAVAVDVARRAAENLAESLSDQAADTFEAIDEVLLTFSQRVNNLGNGNAARLQLRDDLAALVATMPRIHRMDVIDARGRFLVSNISATPAWLPSVKDRPYFRYHRDHLDETIHISGPAQSKTEKMWVIFATRRIERRDGSFGGVLIAPIPFNYFEQTYRRVDVGRFGSITLLADDGTVMMREPLARIRASAAREPLFNDPYRWLQAGTYFDAAPADGLPRLVAFRRLGRYPLVVAVAFAESEYLRDWREDTIRKGLTVVFMLACFGVLAVRLDAQIRRGNAAEAALARLAMLDGLTGLANRRQFDATLDREWRQGAREGVPLALLMIDVDNFKAYNDTYGHQQGDDVLVQISRAIASAGLRPSDIAARYGGEEFAVILPRTDAYGVTTVAERIRGAVAELALPHAHTAAGVATVSVGAASIVPPHGPTPRVLVEAADRALYVAKAAGRNRIASAPVEAAPAPPTR